MLQRRVLETCCSSRPQRLLLRAKYHHRIGLAYHAWLLLAHHIRPSQTIHPYDVPMNCAYCHRPADQHRHYVERWKSRHNLRSMAKS